VKRAVDLFSGAGGASEGVSQAGYEVLGVEHDWDAANSHAKAGHDSLWVDGRSLDPRPFDGVDHFHASPPCTTFSAAGRGKGRGPLDELVAAVKRVLHGGPHGLLDPDETTLLTLEPARWLAQIRPATISFEQVRAVLPVWEAYADTLRDLGYSVWTGLISAETLGVPQTRVRAWLGARCDGVEARPPTPTHSAYYPRTPDRLDDGVDKWVSMAEALGWPTGLVAGFPRRADSDDVVTIDGVDYRARDLRTCDHPAQTVTEKARSWIAVELASRRDSDAWVESDGPRPNRNGEQPAPTITGEAHRWKWLVAAGVTEAGVPRSVDHPAPSITGKGTAYKLSHPAQYRGPGGWNPNLPATTVAGDPRITARGHHNHGEQGRKPVSSGEVRAAYEAGVGVDDVNRPMRLTVEEALVLQGFRPDYPLHGPRTARFRQVGNAVPPPVARAVVEALGS
jgi:DNA (cytosine-5)-methyltransferase 1